MPEVTKSQKPKKKARECNEITSEKKAKSPSRKETAQIPRLGIPPLPHH
jgi:hypothetical protein